MIPGKSGAMLKMIRIYKFGQVLQLASIFPLFSLNHLRNEPTIVMISKSIQHMCHVQDLSTAHRGKCKKITVICHFQTVVTNLI